MRREAEEDLAKEGLPLLRPLRRRKGGGTPDLRVSGVYRVVLSVAGGGASVGVAAARSAFWSPRSELLLAAASCCGDGSVGVPPRGRLGDGGVRVVWGSRPSARLSSLRCFLRRRSGACKVCRRCFLSSDVEPVQGKRWKGGWSGAGRPIFRRLQLDHAAEAFWPMVVHCFKIRRSTAGSSRFLKAWWCTGASSSRCGGGLSSSSLLAMLAVGSGGGLCGGSASTLLFWLLCSECV